MEALICYQCLDGEYSQLCNKTATLTRCQNPRVSISNTHYDDDDNEDDTISFTYYIHISFSDLLLKTSISIQVVEIFYNKSLNMVYSPIVNSKPSLIVSFYW